MALRDGRSGSKALLLSMSCAVLAVASVVAAFSFRANIQSSIQSQAKALLGADLALRSREAFSKEDEALFRSLGGAQSRQIAFASMAYFPRGGGSRLVQVRALSGRFPYYGVLETEPALSVGEFHGAPNALVDESVMLQFGAQVGDRVRIGDYEFRIAGRLRKIPGESLAFSLISPRIYIPMEYLDRTRLVQKGSLVRYQVFFKFDKNLDVDALVGKLAPELQRLDLDADTVSRRAASIGAVMENLSRYLRLAVFVAVLLAGVGIASVVHVYAKAKAHSVALLRCIGAAPGETLWVYLLQVFVLTLAGSLIGAGLGAAAQYALPYALKDFLPVTTVARFSPAGIAAGLAVGLATAFLFVLMPLLPLRRISPLVALRAAFDAERPSRDGWVWAVGAAVIIGIAVFAVATTGDPRHGLWFTGGVAVVFSVLLGLARAGSALMRKLAPGILNFPWRQGLANLHRPNNQTAAVTLAIGVGAFLLVTIASVQSTLLDHVAALGGESEPNLVLFDVQPDQRGDLRDLMHAWGVGVRAEVPIVTMRLSAVKGKSVETLRADPAARIPRWALRREYRSTYRSELSGTEKIVEGAWQGKVAAATEIIPVSLERGIADTLKTGLGDELRFEIQGVPIVTRIASIREVEWQRVQPNFFVVFPAGAIDDAPQFFAVVGRANAPEASARLQRAVVERFPNVSVIDLSLILDTVNAILGKVAAAIRVVALFIIMTGFAVLSCAVLGSRAQRVKESILLRTLGAPRGQIMRTVIAEYLFLGSIAGVAGALLGVGATWGLTWYFFGAPLRISIAPIALILFAVIGATVLTGALGSLHIFRHSPLEALRAEA
jgi:putative ABC transport system permease protein